MSRFSPYRGCTVTVTTKHGKEQAVRPAFADFLDARVEALELDTDTLGTFSGEVARTGSPLECARRKCEWGLEAGGGDFGVASEGSFGPHPLAPFAGSGEEILYFIDRRRGLHLHVREVTLETNYRTGTVATRDELRAFAAKAGFPRHALILRPAGAGAKQQLYKGLQTEQALDAAFLAGRRRSKDGRVRIETDMRAHLNPTRMRAIAGLARKLAERLATPCPACAVPGWGVLGAERGLPCAWCGAETARVRFEVHGCAGCGHRESRAPSHGLEKADPGDCPRCNP